jgi:hypothetical protein
VTTSGARLSSSYSDVGLEAFLLVVDRVPTGSGGVTIIGDAVADGGLPPVTDSPADPPAWNALKEYVLALGVGGTIPITPGVDPREAMLLSGDGDVVGSVAGVSERPGKEPGTTGEGSKPPPPLPTAVAIRWGRLVAGLGTIRLLGDDPGVDVPDAVDVPGSGSGIRFGEGLLLRLNLEGAMTLISSKPVPLF